MVGLVSPLKVFYMLRILYLTLINRDTMSEKMLTSWFESSEQVHGVLVRILGSTCLCYKVCLIYIKNIPCITIIRNN